MTSSRLASPTRSCSPALCRLLSGGTSTRCLLLQHGAFAVGAVTASAVAGAGFVAVPPGINPAAVILCAVSLHFHQFGPAPGHAHIALAGLVCQRAMLFPGFAQRQQIHKAISVRSTLISLNLSFRVGLCSLFRPEIASSFPLILSIF